MLLLVLTKKRPYSTFKWVMEFYRHTHKDGTANVSKKGSQTNLLTATYLPRVHVALTVT